MKVRSEKAMGLSVALLAARLVSRGVGDSGLPQLLLLPTVVQEHVLHLLTERRAIVCEVV